MCALLGDVQKPLRALKAKSLSTPRLVSSACLLSCHLALSVACLPSHKPIVPPQDSTLVSLAASSALLTLALDLDTAIATLRLDYCSTLRVWPGLSAHMK